MNLLVKLREKGISGILETLIRRISRPINRLLYRCYAHLPIEENLIVLESEGDFCDNAYALYDHMRKNGYLKTYRVCWLVDYPKDPRFSGYENTVFVSKSIDRINRPLIRALACCKYYIYDHNCLYAYLKEKQRPEQKVAYLTHGAGFKAAKGGPVDQKPPFDVMYATGDLTADILANFWNCPMERIVKAGYPRLDYCFMPEDPAGEVVRRALNFDRYAKIVVWMPTFRQCSNKSISEDYLQNQTGLPLLNTKEEMEELDRFLQSKNILMILKVHHLQAALPIFRETFRNLLILQDQQLRDMGVQLYQFIAQTDALVTDYSSVSVEYMLLGRPVIYTLDDYEGYAASRGIYPANAIDYMKGHHVYQLDQLYEALGQLVAGEDPYREERAKIVDTLFTYADGNAAGRIIADLGIEK